MISANKNAFINCQAGDLNNQGIIDRWETDEFGFIEISGFRNQCLQHSMNAFIVMSMKLK